MPVGLSAAVANGYLDQLFTGYPHVKLHVGDPGAAGTSNPAVNTTRVQATTSAAAGGAKTNSAEMVWSNVAGAEDYTHISGWSAGTGGTFGWSGLMTANAVQIGDQFRIPVGDLDSTLTVAA